MLYDTCRKSPDPGSILEHVFIIIRAKRDYKELLQTFALAQAMRDDESGRAAAEAFDKYKEAVLPYLKSEQDKADVEIRKAMKEELARGPLSVKRIASTKKVRSRLNEVARSLREPPVRWKRKFNQ